MTAPTPAPALARHTDDLESILHLHPDAAAHILTENVQDVALLLLGRNGRVLDARAGTERLLGFKPTSLVGQPISVLYTPEDVVLGRRDQDLIRARDEGHTRYVAWHVRQDGDHILAGVSIVPVWRSGALLGYSLVLRDVAEERQAADDLAARVDTLEQLNRRKDASLAMISHELRNPLAAMMNALAIIRLEESTDPYQLRAREIVDRQARQLVALVADLAEASRLQVGKLQLRKQRVDLRLPVQAAAETCRPLLESRRHRFLLQLPAQPVWVHADVSRLEQVFVNLVNNAAKYTPEDGQIDVCLQTQGPKAVVQVRDSGVGIAPDLIARIFDLFTQANQGAQGGMGIGLAVARSLVGLHEGTIEARSPGIGMGSEFVVHLPVSPQDGNGDRAG